MTDDDAIPSDTQAWLSGIGARLPGTPVRSPDTPGSPDELADHRHPAATVGLEDPACNPDPAQHSAADITDDTASSAADATPAPAHDATNPPLDSAAPRRWLDRWRGRFNLRIAGVMAAVTVLGTAATAAVTALDTAPAPPHPQAPTSRQRPSPPPQPASSTAFAADQNLDGPIPFMASSDCDPAGSTPAQSLANPNGDTPWLCVLHGPGQVLTLQLGPPGVPQAYVITGVSIIPGDIGPKGRRPTDPDPWLAHRVVTLLQYHFANPGNLFLDQNTFNTRGEVPMAVPHVLASTVTIIIRQTSRPPTDPTPTPTGDQPNLAGGILGGPPPGARPAPGDQQPQHDEGNQSDPSDGTFAISSIKIIGHKAL